MMSKRARTPIVLASILLLVPIANGLGPAPGTEPLPSPPVVTDIYIVAGCLEVTLSAQPPYANVQSVCHPGRFIVDELLEELEAIVHEHGSMGGCFEPEFSSEPPFITETHLKCEPRDLPGRTLGENAGS